MSAKAGRWLVIAYLAASAVLLTYPGIVPFNRVSPRILGLPFDIFWVALLVGLGFVVLLIEERVLTREEDGARRSRRD